MDTPILHSDHWRWRTDDGGEGSGGASWHELEDIAHTFDAGSSELDVNVRLRFSLHVTAFGTTNQRWDLERNVNGGSFVRVDAASTIARSSISSQFTTGDHTTEHGVTYVGSGAFFTTDEGMDDVDGRAGGNANDPLVNDFESVEFCFQIREVDLSNGDVVRFRVTNIGTPLTTEVLAVANITIPAGGGLSIPVAMAHYRRLHEAN